MGITRPVAMVASVRVTVPIILGHLKPVILLPAVALSGLDTVQIEAIVAYLRTIPPPPATAAPAR